MRQITAKSVGSTWRQDVLAAAVAGAVEVVNASGRHLGTVSLSSSAPRHMRYLLNGEHASFTTVWAAMDKWAGAVWAEPAAQPAAQPTQVAEFARLLAAVRECISFEHIQRAADTMGLSCPAVETLFGQALHYREEDGSGAH